MPPRVIPVPVLDRALVRVALPSCAHHALTPIRIPVKRSGLLDEAALQPVTKSSNNPFPNLLDDLTRGEFPRAFRGLALLWALRLKGLPCFSRNGCLDILRG